jgi:hypothetical protein
MTELIVYYHDDIAALYKNGRLYRYAALYVDIATRAASQAGVEFRADDAFWTGMPEEHRKAGFMPAPSLAAIETYKKERISERAEKLARAGALRVRALRLKQRATELQQQAQDLEGEL